jgi:5'-nucleotidase
MTDQESDNERLILLTNDDGVKALGLRCLRRTLSRLGRVIVVAPSEERSGSSHSLTMHQPVRISSSEEDVYAVTGTPVDCVIFALRKILPRLPDLVVSGLNHGPNLGDDVLYSGTVGAAREAALAGVPSLAVSLLGSKKEEFVAAAEFVVRLISEVRAEKLPEGLFLNINVPRGCPSEYRFTRQATKRADSAVEEKKDPRGRTYYWIGADLGQWNVHADSDYQAVQNGLISVTPLQRDQTDYRALETFLK